MYDPNYYNDDQPLEYFLASIRVCLMQSQICSDDYDANSCPESQQNILECVLELPIFRNLGVPIDALIEELSKYSKIDFANSQILYKLPNSQLYMLAGVFPFEENTDYIPVENVSETIFLKYRTTFKSTKETDIHEEAKVKTRRGNERLIGNVLDALTQFKELSKIGIMDPIRGLIKYKRHEAAQILNIPKKTLDDYLAQVKLAHSFGFDFQSHCEEKFGVLRKFNRKMIKDKR